MLYHQYLKKLKFCPFCKSSGRIFLEREHAYLTYAKSPYHPHHLLVTPKRHLVSFFGLKPGEKKDIDELIKVGAGLLKKLKYRNFKSEKAIRLIKASDICIIILFPMIALAI